MKVQQRSLNEERVILIGMIVDRTVLGRIATKWTLPMFRAPYANKVGDWCVQYHKRYGKAPGPHLQHIYESWAANAKNDELIGTVGQFLDGLSRQYQRLRRQSNSDYLIDKAGAYFNRVRLERLTDTLTGDLDVGDTERALSRVAKYRKLDMGVGECVDVLGDQEALRTAFATQGEPLIRFSDGLGKFFGNHLERDGLIAFQGPEKRGKSFWLQELAFAAVLARLRVAFFECGDLSQHQIMRRFMVRVSCHPLSAGQVKYPQGIKLKQQKEGPPLVLLREQTRVYKKPLTWRKAWRACKKLTKRRRLKSVWRLSCHYNATLSIDGMQEILDEWGHDDWIPDVIVIDYADILAMEYPGLEGRERYDHTWKQLRRLSQERHCLVVTATQAAARAYKVQTQSQDHFSEDKRKNAHVTGMVGLNQTPLEKEQGIMRLNWIELREGFFSPYRCCYVATCPQLANMSVRSVF
jgi:hypothetical protein